MTKGRIEGELTVAVEDGQSVGTSLTCHEVQGELGRELGGDCVPGSEGGSGSDQSKRGGSEGGKKELHGGGCEGW